MAALFDVPDLKVKEFTFTCPVPVL